MVEFVALASLGAAAAFGLGLLISWWWLRPLPDVPLPPAPAEPHVARADASGRGTRGSRGRLLAGGAALLAGRALDSLVPFAPAADADRNRTALA